MNSLGLLCGMPWCAVNVPSHTVAAFFDDLRHIKQLAWVPVKQSTNILDQRHSRHGVLPRVESCAAAPTSGGVDR
ncbi:MAG: hypothetical protein ACKPKO_61130, partial [Candidatus Fonsibacter sp.]